MIQDSRIRLRNLKPEQSGAYVLYWMQASHRLSYNHALTYATRLANEGQLPVLIGFGLTDDYPEANERHYAFMLEGLDDVCRGAEKLGYGFATLKGSPDDVAIELSKEATTVVVDRGYLKIQKAWRARVAETIACRLIEVESDAVIPVRVASDKPEYAARTMRLKIHPQLPGYLKPMVATRPKVRFEQKVRGALNVQDVDGVLAGLCVDRSVGKVTGHRGGEVEASRRLSRFLSERLGRYDADRNDPNLDGVSDLSPYLHFGQISALEIALQTRKAASEAVQEGVDSFLEQLIVRRELSVNFCEYTLDYDRYDCLPEWAQQTLDRHRDDPRPFVYSREELENARTHDPYWNAAQLEMVATGKMHNYMRMYWGKKVLEWGASPEEAYENALYLNNKYELDGRDVNSFAGVAWCFGKHDRPWKERPVFGTVRYMNAKGLRRKFDADGYVRKVAKVAGRDLSSQQDLF